MSSREMGPRVEGVMKAEKEKLHALMGKLANLLVKRQQKRTLHLAQQQGLSH